MNLTKKKHVFLVKPQTGLVRDILKSQLTTFPYLLFLADWPARESQNMLPFLQLPEPLRKFRANYPQSLRRCSGDYKMKRGAAFEARRPVLPVGWKSSSEKVV